MRALVPILALCTLLAVAGAARADQIRLRNGQFLQCEVIPDQTDEKVVTIRLYRTGGTFQIRWDQVIREDEDRIREDLGLKPVDIEEVPTVPGHEVLLVTGERVWGLVENPEGTAPVVMRTATGRREYPRGKVSKISPAEVEALEVYSPEELFEMYRSEIRPETPSAHVDLADRCMQVGAYDKAKEEYELALGDPEFQGSERAPVVRNRLARCEILLKAKGATDKVKEIKLLAFRDKFDEALKGIDDLQAQYAENPAILNLLSLDRLKRQITNDRRTHYLTEVRRRFYRTLASLVAKKVRDKDATLNDSLAWAQNTRGLGREILAEIATETGLTEAQAREFWDQRTSKQVHRFTYRSGTFMNREVSDRVRKALTSARQNQNRSAQNARGGNQGRQNPQPKAQQKQDTPTTPDEWWKGASPRDREDFVKAWFAEYGGMVEVVRFESRTCGNCGGKGVTVTHDAASDEDVRRICDICNLAGHERIVIVR